jgi:hypothetical protein
MPYPTSDYVIQVKIEPTRAFLEREKEILKKIKEGNLNKSELLFINKVSIKEEEGACWIWSGYKDSLGYGRVGRRINGISKTVGAHRFLINDLIEGGLYCCHHCDNPSCVRPSHMFAGTTKDNIRDCIKKGRFNYKDTTGAIVRYSTGRIDRRGEMNGKSKLTLEQATRARNCPRGYGKIAALAREFGVSPVTIRKIRNGYGWPEIPITKHNTKRKFGEISLEQLDKNQPTVKLAEFIKD